MAQDYILRLVEQVALMLAQLMRLPKAERSMRLAEICLRETGLPFELVQRSSPATILQLLATGGATQYSRAVILAELLLQDAEMKEADGKQREALVSRAQARALLEPSIDKLAPEEETIYRAKLESLVTAARI